MPPDAPKWGAEHKRMLRTYFTHTMSLLSHTTSLAVEQNTVTTDPDMKDAWGLPGVRITYNFVTSGRQQPTATIQALAYRAADHIIRAARAVS